MSCVFGETVVVHRQFLVYFAVPGVCVCVCFKGEGGGREKGKWAFLEWKDGRQFLLGLKLSEP